eukprot:Tbor_TRINITY_DN5213_c5_g4::TRINITY_DN5213_c5_g4_i4::g.16238::m.16238
MKVTPDIILSLDVRSPLIIFHFDDCRRSTVIPNLGPDFPKRYLCSATLHWDNNNNNNNNNNNIITRAKSLYTEMDNKYRWYCSKCLLDNSRSNNICNNCGNDINNNNNNNTLIYNNTPSIHDCSDGVLIAPEDYRPNSTCSITVNETYTNPYSSERTSGRAEWTVPDQTIENDPIPLEGHYEALSELSETLPPLETNDEDAAVGVRKPTYKLKNDVNSTKEIRRDNPSLHLQTDTPSGKVYEAAFPFLRGLNDNNNNSSNDNNISLEVDAVDTHLLLEPIHSASPQRSHSPNRSALYFPNPKLSDCHNRPSHSNTAPQPVVAHVRVKL